MLKKIFKIFLVFERFQISRIQKYLKSENIDIIFDIGAHEGIFFENFYKKKKLKKIYCFEPQKKYYDYLCNKFENNSLYQIEHKAIDTDEHAKTLNINEEDSTSTMSELDVNSFLFKLKNFILNKKNSYFLTEKINCIRLDTYLKEKDIREISLLYMDTEGYQLNILKSLGGKINNVRYILFRNKLLHPFKNYNFDEINNYLLSNNFTIKKKFLHLGLTAQHCLYEKKV
jgi:FkbM family methyltransferase